MVLILAVGAAIYFTAKEVRRHKKKQRALNARKAVERGLVESVFITGDTKAHHLIGSLPPYHEENLPPYH